MSSRNIAAKAISFGAGVDGGQRVFDSGSEFERITASLIPDNFNGNNDENSFDNRSDHKGPEPEAITTGTSSGFFVCLKFGFWVAGRCLLGWQECVKSRILR
ncbi:hypothetical protein [Marinobacter sp. CHS3-4]|uniref:choice-of-anchor I domain-containing protein n=1 Tax=Marinobacter sp. CHS3-4 TaxID=3045174 RepID=UPI0024B55494|nr:hypothetical protein [Marinobacter sp. CHS3-4]MDI9244230.1 hypothetical protein [Marinobacter sp. CHS3-4]